MDSTLTSPTHLRHNRDRGPGRRDATTIVIGRLTRWNSGKVVPMGGIDLEATVILDRAAAEPSG